MAFSEELHERLYQLELEQERQLREIESLQRLPLFDVKSLEKKSTIPIVIAPQISHLPKVSSLPKGSARLTGGHAAQTGYKILLDFGNGHASEWSEDTRGWRSKNQGSCYPTMQIANEKLRELKSRWPDYPLILFALD
jgi:hypothetical protein